MMTPEKPAEGILKAHQYSDLAIYSVKCICGNPDCDINISVEYDKDTDDIVVTFDSTQKTHWWKTLFSWEVHKIDNPILYWMVNTTQSFINGLHQRLKLTKEIWWNGFIEYQSSTIMSKQTALNLAEAVKTSIEELDKNG